MKTEAVMERMIAFSEGNLHDINHFVKVYGYAQTIGRLEGLDDQTQLALEVAAIVHDIACPLCREKYGHAAGKLQEQEGPALVEKLFLDMEKPLLERVCWLVGHHHTYTDVNTMDHQILLEADYLVNADEGKAAREAIETMEKQVFRTSSGKRLLQSMYL